MDWLSFDIDGVGGVCAVFSARPPRLKVANDGFVGVSGNDSDDITGARLKALLEGRKMPDPGIDVLK